MKMQNYILNNNFCVVDLRDALQVEKRLRSETLNTLQLLQDAAKQVHPAVDLQDAASFASREQELLRQITGVDECILLIY